MSGEPRFAEPQLLRFIACGSVDDGKSTLIGRLLFDSKSMFADQLEAVEHSSRRRGLDFADLSLLTDALLAEREQGITIDVAYRYFSTARRRFIVADTPGHEQYTRNMVTAASTADLAVILLDARKGVQAQTRRHTFLARLVGIRRIVVAINKMDLVGCENEVFKTLRADFLRFAGGLGFGDIRFIPISALHGDMVVERGDRLDWYRGETLLETLQSIPLDDAAGSAALPFRFPVQLVTRLSAFNGNAGRGYMGRIESGAIAVGDEIVVLPSGTPSRVRAILTFDGARDAAQAGESVTLTLDDEVDVSRGDMLADATARPHALRNFEAMLCWFAREPLDPQRRYLVRHSTRTVPGVVNSVNYRIDVNTFGQEKPDGAINMNNIVSIGIKVQQPLVFDAYEDNRATGSFILIDGASNNTVAAGMIL